MAEILKFYAGMALFTGIYVGFDMAPAMRPRGTGEWLAFAGLMICWPVAFLYALYWAIKQRGGI